MTIRFREAGGRELLRPILGEGLGGPGDGRGWDPKGSIYLQLRQGQECSPWVSLEVLMGLSGLSESSGLSAGHVKRDGSWGEGRRQQA